MHAFLCDYQGSRRARNVAVVVLAVAASATRIAPPLQFGGHFSNACMHPF